MKHKSGLGEHTCSFFKSKSNTLHLALVTRLHFLLLNPEFVMDTVMSHSNSYQADVVSLSRRASVTERYLA